MNPKLNKRYPTARRVSMSGADGFSKTSVRDQAALLLSIAEIVKVELKSDKTTLFSETEIPKMPQLIGSSQGQSFPPKNKDLSRSALSDFHLMSRPSRNFPSSGRVRSVSIDTPDINSPGNRTPSPLALTEEPKPVTPSVTPSPRKGLRVSTRKRKQPEPEPEYEDDDEDELSLSLLNAHKSSGPLQGSIPKGVTIMRISRRKFSWKNYPELEQFLIANREEYLRHSAMNYTVQQKQYNNRLTERLLELSTENGYVFDEAEFSFVTVRDRIRCYYKSYVQSAKKRGVLMGYAARKAGLLSSKDLSTSGEIYES